MRRHGAKNADDRAGLTCLYDNQLLGACLHASESGGRSRPEAVRACPRHSTQRADPLSLAPSPLGGLGWGEGREP